MGAHTSTDINEADGAESTFVLHCRGRQIDCTPPHPEGAVVMGILNVTPDSFSDGGRFLDESDALRQAERMVREGATVIDVGGESSRPAGTAYGEGAARVPAEEELRRIAPVLRSILRELPEAVVSVDTYKPEVVRVALELGAHIINDVTALRNHPETASLVAEAGAALVLMHSIGRPGAMPQEHRYGDVVAHVVRELSAATTIARDAGVRSIVLDPGFGFGKSVAENFALLGSLDRLVRLNCPVLIGVSRKNSIGIAASPTADPLPVSERLPASLGATAAAVMNGATLVRTHDVRATSEMLRVLARALGRPT